ncbi:P-loop NTPase family protein [Bacillus massilinigeriensis]|uniref:hypothetical protein n=1 Tax=Bacillus mediterraneensis TaxID=1805474 RepID=UPI0008F864E2|nr:hypothetical protein [Bacillus mediterraneensis]
MIASKLFWLDVRGLHSKFYLYVALIGSIFPAFGIAYSIKNLDGPFTILHVTSFYALFGSILCVSFGMNLFTKDMGSGVNTLIFNSQTNRKKYVLSKFTGFLYIGLVFGITCSLMTLGMAYYLNSTVELSLYLKSILNYILFSVLYATFFLFISLFYRKVTVLFVIAVLSISFLPNLVSTLLEGNILPASVEKIVEKVPFYFFPILIGSHNLSGMEYLIVALSIVVVLLCSLFAISKQDY